MGLNVNGPGAVILTASNAYTGATRITGGTLQMGVSITPTAPPASSVLEYTFAGLTSPVTSGTTIPDVSGNGNTGTMQGGSATLVSGPQGKQGVNFNGSYVSVPYSSSINLNTWTNSVWVNISSSAGGTCILNARNSTINTTGYGCDEYYYPNGGNGYFYTELTVAGNPDGSGGGWVAGSLSDNSFNMSNGWHLVTTTVSPHGGANLRGRQPDRHRHLVQHARPNGRYHGLLGYRNEAQQGRDHADGRLQPVQQRTHPGPDRDDVLRRPRHRLWRPAGHEPRCGSPPEPSST